MLWAELKTENGHSYRHPGIANYDQVAAESTATEDDKEVAVWGQFWQHMLWRFGRDASIHQPSGLYLTASRGEPW